MTLPPGCSSEFDNAFDQIPGLTWLPWVGAQWERRPADRRLLVVGESHYFVGKTPEDVAVDIENKTKRFYHRGVVSESLVNDEWTTPTLHNIPKLIFGDGSLNRTRFWSETGYYNFVQRLMNYTVKERPTWDDFYAGWAAFHRVVEILQPSFCLFVGVGATHSLWQGLQQAGREPFMPELRTKVGTTRGRRAVLEFGARKIELAFVRHAGSYFSWRGWHEYLQAEHPTLMEWLRDEGYATD